MRTEDLHDDFVPTLDMGDEPTAHAGVDVPAEEADDDGDEIEADDGGEVQTAETEPTPDAPETVVPDMDADTADDDEDEDDDPGEPVQQMSLF